MKKRLSLDIIAKLYDARLIDLNDLADLKCYIGGVESACEK